MRYLSNSEASCFKRCRRKWWLGWYRDLEPVEGSHNDARSKGNRVHTALAALYDPVNPRDPREALEEVIRAQQPVRVQDPELSAALESQWTKATDLERAMVEGYVEWLAESGADEDLEVVSAEQSLQAQLTETVILLGRLDVRVRYRSRPHVVRFMDHKTTGSFEALTKRLNQDEQLLTYDVLERAHVTDPEGWTDGAIYNMLRKVKRTASAKPPFFQRVEIRFNTHQVETFRVRIELLGKIIENTVRALDELSVEAQAQFAYPTPNDTCDWSCEFKTVCPMFDDGSRAEDLLAQRFVASPLTVRYPELVV